MFLRWVLKTLSVGKQAVERKSTISQINLSNRLPISNCYLKAVQVEKSKILFCFVGLDYQNWPWNFYLGKITIDCKTESKSNFLPDFFWCAIIYEVSSISFLVSTGSE